MPSIEEQIRRKGLELGFSNVGFAPVRDYPEYLEEARSRSNYDIFAGSAVALGNSGHADHLPALRTAREATDNPDVIKAIDWAIDKLNP